MNDNFEMHGKKCNTLRKIKAAKKEYGNKFVLMNYKEIEELEQMLLKDELY